MLQQSDCTDVSLQISCMRLAKKYTFHSKFDFVWVKSVLLEAAGFLGMSVEMLDRVYGHHHPEHLRGAAHALVLPPAAILAITLAPARRPRPPERQTVGNNGGPGSCPTSSNLNYLLKVRVNRGALKLQDDFFATRTPF